MAPPIVFAVKLKVFPTQSGLLLPAVGAAGIGLIVATVVPAGPVHPFSVAVTEYVPDSAVVAPTIIGFCVMEEKLLGPLHK